LDRVVFFLSYFVIGAIGGVASHLESYINEMPSTSKYVYFDGAVENVLVEN
jgi:hypothetical protein